MSVDRAPRLLLAACIGSLAALALMTWQLFDPRVVPVIIAMSLGQVLGTASFAVYGYVVLVQLRVRPARAHGPSPSPAPGKRLTLPAFFLPHILPFAICMGPMRLGPIAEYVSTWMRDRIDRRLPDPRGGAKTMGHGCCWELSL